MFRFEYDRLQRLNLRNITNLKQQRLLRLIVRYSNGINAS